MNRPHFRRRPRPTDPEPYTRLDHLDGLPGRVAAPKWADLFGIDPQFPADQSDGLPGRTRYDAEWPDVIAAEVGGDLAVMAAPADWGEYDIEPEMRAVVHYGSVAGCALCAEPVEPHGRHRQTDPLDLILADLRDLDGLS